MQVTKAAIGIFGSLLDWNLLCHTPHNYNKIK